MASETVLLTVNNNGCESSETYTITVAVPVTWLGITTVEDNGNIVLRLVIAVTDSKGYDS